VLNCDVNELTGGHFVGKLLSIEKTGDRTDIYLEDDTGSVVLCELHLYFDHLPLNESLSTHVHVAVAEPERAKITNAKKYPNFLYKYKLVFKLGCSLILNGRRFNGGKGSFIPTHIYQRLTGIRTRRDVRIKLFLR
jgi:hypothetical protein